MLYHAKFGVLQMGDTPMEYIRFGNGRRTLVMLPGLGDSLRTMKGTQLPLAWMYRLFAKTFTVYVFARKQDLPWGCTTRDMARDLHDAMELLGIEKADLFGVSMGGMIAQHFAIDYPQMVGKLVLAVTSSKSNPTLRESIAEWTSCAQRGDHTAFMDSNLRRIYSEDYCRKNGWMVPLLGKLTKPKSYDPFFCQAEACLNHDAYEMLSLIQAPALVIGGEKDLALSGEASREIAQRIPNARLHMYPQWGHGLYEEAKDFCAVVYSYLTENDT